MNKVFCIFEIQSSKIYFVSRYDSKEDADIMCECLNDFRNGDYCRFLVRCLEMCEYDTIMKFLLQHPDRRASFVDVSSVYDPFIQRIFVRA